MVHGCDPNAWHGGSDGYTRTLLHRAILLEDTPTACFLIRNGADVNSPTRPVGAVGGSMGSSSSSSKKLARTASVSPEESSSPLHMACERGLKSVVECLVEHHVDVNVKVGVS